MYMSFIVGCMLLVSAGVLSGPEITTALQRYSLRSQAITYAQLDPVLVEISGLASTPDGRLFAVNDEQGIVFQLNPATGDIVKSFRLHTPPVAADFEGLCFARGKFFMTTSTGDIYEFAEGDDNTEVAYTVRRTGFGREYELEGLCYDPTTDALLLPAKRPLADRRDQRRPVFAYSLALDAPLPEPRFVLFTDDLAAGGKKKKLFNPSSIEFHPATGTFFLLAAQGCAIAEISAAGEVLQRTALNPKLFTKPEGVTVMPDNTLYLSSEGKSTKNKPAALGSYLPAGNK